MTTQRGILARSRLLITGAVAAGCISIGGAAELKNQQPQQPPKPPPPPSTQIRDKERTFRLYLKSWSELKKEHVVMQQRDYSCGAASLATLIKYHWGDNVTETQLLIEVVKMLTREELQERVRNGLSMTDLRRLAVRVGYQASIGKLELDKLRESKIPLIVGIVIDKFDHFCVYRGMDSEFVYLADPARGNVRTPIDEFKKQWQRNAVLVVVKPGGDLTKKSPLLATHEEMMLGETNWQYLRDQTTTKYVPY
jgi:hypothetical protein